MRAKQDHRAAAVALREAGHTYDEIATELGVSKGSLSLWLRSLPFPSDEQRRELYAPTAHHVLGLCPPPGCDDRVAAARKMREDGLLLREIAEFYKVSVKTAWLWCAGLALPARARHGGDRDHVLRMNRLRWDGELARREQEREGIKTAAARRVGQLTDRELELVAVTAYWCEGSKDKSYDRRETVTFINSDKDLILLWLEFLRRRGITVDRLRLNLSIHESADVPKATCFWAEVIGLDDAHFGSPMLKRHNPKTTRKNTTDAYVGCLVVRVLQGRTLYQEIEGVWRGIASGLARGVAS